MIDGNLADTDLFLTPVAPRTAVPTDSSLVEVDHFGMSDQGKVRGNNEDTFLIARFDRSMQALSTNLPENEYPSVCSETSYGMLVADGMGGAAAGEVASRTAARVLLDLVLQTPDWIMRLDDTLVEEIFQRTKRRVRDIQDTLKQQAQVDESLSGMGTTLTLAWSLGHDLLIAHVGDSRAYLLREGRLQQLTKDQTVAQSLVDAGAMSAKTAATHRLRHVLTGVLSTGAADVPIQFLRFHLADGDQLLLCSDGLTEMVEEAGIVDVLSRSDSAPDACRALIDRALQAGGKDNVTVALARYHFPESVPD